MTKKELQAELAVVQAEAKAAWEQVARSDDARDRALDRLRHGHQIALDNLNHRAGLLAQQHQAELDMIRREATIIAKEEAFKQAQQHYEKIIGHLTNILGVLAPGAADAE